MREPKTPWIPYVPRRPRVLIVDDQPSNVRTLYRLFRAHCDLFLANDGQQVLEICHLQNPDLILLDVVMSGIDGYQICLLLKSDPQLRDIPVIFISERNDVADEIRSLELGAVDFISKPFNPVIVRARVRTHLVLKLQGDMLRASALLDGLTGVANRRRFDEDLDLHWRHCQRDAQPLSLVLLDVDHFKAYNDRYGHLAGDQCLREVAKALSGCLRRPLDRIARYGGEEFACLLPNTECQGARNLAESMRQAILALAIEHAESSVAGQVTASFGVATQLPLPELPAETLLQAADRQLYLAKGAGRNRVHAAPCDTPLHSANQPL